MRRDHGEALPDEDMQGRPGLQLGLEGGAVALLERFLRRMGFYSGPINGQFDAQTDAAVRQQLQALGVVRRLWRSNVGFPWLIEMLRSLRNDSRGCVSATVVERPRRSSKA
jgi:hypothetical protein